MSKFSDLLPQNDPEEFIFKGIDKHSKEELVKIIKYQEKQLSMLGSSYIKRSKDYIDRLRDIETLNKKFIKDYLELTNK